ncbi:MAG TPA: response regulator transcription factor [Gemmatimonadales bacterium]|nr:response regulator transcription factor [Gemmatimonadales bacterium]
MLVIDDNRLVREGLGALIDTEADLKVVASAEDMATGVTRLQQLTPHIVLVDAALDNGDSYRCVEEFRKVAPETRVIVMDLLPAPDGVIEFVKAGAHGFIMKDATVADLVSTIRSVASGATVVPPALTGTLLTHIAQQAADNRLPDVTEAVRMTKREREIVNLIAEGLSNKEIAQRLSIATYTVKSHVHNILEKLALHSRLQIAAYSHKAGPPPAA